MRTSRSARAAAGALLFAIGALCVAACGGAGRGQPEVPRQLPAVSLAAFQAYELKQVALPADLANDEVGQRVAEKVYQNLGKCLTEVLPGIIQAETSAPTGVPTLVVEPVIVDVHLVRIAVRIFVGTAAGGSEIHMQVAYRDKTTGNLVASPEFYQRTAAIKGAHSMGAADQLLLSDIAREICDYTAQGKALPLPAPAPAPAPAASPFPASEPEPEPAPAPESEAVPAPEPTPAPEAASEPETPPAG